MKTYEVRLSDRVENTGLDNQYFATREDAERAAAVVNGLHSAAHAEVSESDSETTITFAAWNEAGW